MKKNAILFALVILLNSCQSSCSSSHSDISSGEKQETVVHVPLGDPFILFYDNVYYAYGTHSDSGIEVYTSGDLKKWKYQGLALNKTDSWGDKWFWAPEVYEHEGVFYMYYSANEHICVAKSNHPAGPFIQEKKEPMIVDEKSIDNSLFIDDDGTPYMFFVRFTDGNAIWVAELEKDLQTIKMETLHPCIHMSQTWEEVWPRVNEGAFVVKRNGIYYMTYSANSYESQFYGIGCATATNIMGEWTKYEENPILQKPGDLVGVGHSAMFVDEENGLRIVFHAHKDKNNLHPRAMYISDVYFEKIDGTERMRISSDYLTPALQIGN